MDANNLKDIKTLIKLFNESALTGMEVSEGDFKLRLEKQSAPPAYTAAYPANVQALPAVQTAQAENDFSKAVENNSGNAVDFNRIKEIKSPMIGIFYAAPSEGSEPYVKIGSKVKRGDTLCIIEAMKMMNEITAEVDGEIVDICAKNGEVIEFSQVIFKVF